MALILFHIPACAQSNWIVEQFSCHGNPFFFFFFKSHNSYLCRILTIHINTPDISTSSFGLKWCKIKPHYLVSKSTSGERIPRWLTPFSPQKRKLNYTSIIYGSWEQLRLLILYCNFGLFFFRDKDNYGRATIPLLEKQFVAFLSSR